MNRSLIWVAWRLLISRKTLFGGSAPLSLLGLTLGVAALVASMAVMSGFESSLQKAMSDVAGHAQVVKRTQPLDDWQELEERIRLTEPSLVSSSRFIFIESILAKQGQIAGVIIQGVDGSRYKEVLNFGGRLESGRLDLSHTDGSPGVLIGKGLAKSMSLKIGDKFRVVVPVADSLDPSNFHRRLGEFQVRGVLDLGKHEWNERFIVSDLKAAQEISGIGERYTGLLLKFQDFRYAQIAASNLSQTLGGNYWVRDWRDSNENLFEAIRVERPGIFFVVLVITLVAAFNVSSTLFVNVVRRFKDIAILKTVGFSRKDIIQIFAMQGLLLGAVGLFFGFIFGYLLCLLFQYAQNRLGLVSGEVYRLENIELSIRWADVMSIFFVTMIICFLATLAPARRGGALNPVEGLRNE